MHSEATSHRTDSLREQAEPEIVPLFELVKDILKPFEEENWRKQKSEAAA